MGDRDFLYGTTSEKPQRLKEGDHGVIMCAETDSHMKVPLLWGALFTAQDCRTRQWSRNGKQHSLSVWHTSLAAGLENLSRRKPWILQHTHPALHPFAEVFGEAMAACKYPYLRFDMGALAAWLSHDRAKVDDRVRQCLDAFETEDGWKAYLGGALVANTYDLYGMQFLFPDWSPLAGQVGWYRVGADGKIEPAGCPASAWVVGEDHEGYPPLPLFFDACARGNLPVVKSLLASGQSVNARVAAAHARGFTGLMLAAQHGRKAVVRELIGAGADVNAVSDNKAVALSLATFADHPEIVDMLLDADADVDAANAHEAEILGEDEEDPSTAMRRYYAAQERRAKAKAAGREEPGDDGDPNSDEG